MSANPRAAGVSEPEVHMRASGRNGSHDGYNFEALVVPRLYLVGSVAVRVRESQRARLQGSDAGSYIRCAQIVPGAILLQRAH